MQNIIIFSQYTLNLSTEDVLEGTLGFLAILLFNSLGVINYS